MKKMRFCSISASNTLMRSIAHPSHRNASKTNPEASKRRYALISSIKVARKMVKVVAKMVKVVPKMVKVVSKNGQSKCKRKQKRDAKLKKNIYVERTKSLGCEEAFCGAE